MGNSWGSKKAQFVNSPKSSNRFSRSHSTFTAKAFAAPSTSSTSYWLMRGFPLAFLLSTSNPSGSWSSLVRRAIPPPAPPSSLRSVLYSNTCTNRPAYRNWGVGAWRHFADAATTLHAMRHFYSTQCLRFGPADLKMVDNPHSLLHFILLHSKNFIGQSGLGSCRSRGKACTATQPSTFVAKGDIRTRKNIRNFSTSNTSNTKEQKKTRGHLDTVVPKESPSQVPLRPLQVHPYPAIRRDPELEELIELVENSPGISQHENNVHHSKRGHPLEETCDGRVSSGLSARWYVQLRVGVGSWQLPAARMPPAAVHSINLRFKFLNTWRSGCEVCGQVRIRTEQRAQI